jgi:hypothetical protein
VVSVMQRVEDKFYAGRDAEFLEDPEKILF